MELKNCEKKNKRKWGVLMKSLFEDFLIGLRYSQNWSLDENRRYIEYFDETLKMILTT